MGLGSTAKKVQQMVEMAEELYKKLNELREQIVALRETVENTSERVETLERENAKQRALLTALAEDADVDVDGIMSEVESAESEEKGDDVAATDGANAGTAGAADNNP